MSKPENDDVGIKEQLTSMAEMFKSFQIKIESIEKKVDSTSSPIETNPLATGLENVVNVKAITLDEMTDLSLGILSDSLHGIGCDLEGADSARFKTWMRISEK
jgi:hypothetical protein